MYSPAGADEIDDGTEPRLAEVPPAVPYGASVTPMMEVIDDDERAFWIAWNRVRGIGPSRFGRLLEFFGDAATAWAAPLREIKGAGIDVKLAEDVVRQRKTIDPQAELARLTAMRVVALTLRDLDYPRLLREIALPPAVLYIRGQLTAADERAIAIVGTRHMTTYGRQVTDRLARDLAAQGLTVVSGLARGVDGVAHSAALEAGGRTIAVLGCGVDLVYPPEHAKLAARIVEHGAVVSDFPLGSQPEGGNFPARNRIISGLVAAVLVTEAPEGSGALITTDFAAEQGRDVMAVPGSILSRASAGCHQLIRTGAVCVTSAQDVLQELNVHLIPQQLDMRDLLPEDPVEAQLLALLHGDARHIDDLCREAELAAATVSSALAMLELKGIVRNLGGMTYGRMR